MVKWAPVWAQSRWCIIPVGSEHCSSLAQFPPSWSHQERWRWAPQGQDLIQRVHHAAWGSKPRGTQSWEEGMNWLLFYWVCCKSSKAPRRCWVFSLFSVVSFQRLLRQASAPSSSSQPVREREEQHLTFATNQMVNIYSTLFTMQTISSPSTAPWRTLQIISSNKATWENAYLFSDNLWIK